MNPHAFLLMPLLPLGLSAALAATPLPDAPPPSGGPAGRTDVGQHLYGSRCTACHAVDEHRVGPRHRGVMGRLAGTSPGYDYSSGLKRARIIWTPVTLDRWLADPEAMVQHQQMDFKVPDAQDRADLIAYLATLR